MISLKPTSAFLIRNWKSGELQLIAFAIFISVICISSVAFLTQGLHLGLEDKTGGLLGGDRAISSPTPISTAIIKKAESLNLDTTETVSFTSVLLRSEKFALIDVTAVKENYPLRGELRTASKLYVQDEQASTIPKPGTVWLESRLFPLLNVKIGDILSIGRASFKITRILTGEPAQTLQGFDFAPRALINYRDVHATEIVKRGNRASYKFLVAGDPESLEKFESWVTPKLAVTQTFLDARSTRSLIKAVLERTKHYLGLVFVINITLAGVAIAMVSRRFSERQFDTIAILRCFGAQSGWIFARYLFSFIFLGLIAGVLGIVFGYVSQFFIARIFLFKELFSYKMPGIIGVSTGISFFTIFALLFGFALPPLLNLLKVPPLRVLRRDLEPPKISNSLIVIVALTAIAGLLVLQTRDINLTGVMIAALIGISMAVLLVIYVLLKGIGKISHVLNILSQLSMRNVARCAGKNAFQVMAFSLVIAFAMILFLVRNDLLETWENQVPEKAPNYFVINIQRHTLASFKSFFQHHKIDTSTFYPMVLSRLLAINKYPVKMHFDIAPSKHSMNRLLELTWSLELQRDNQIVQGVWFNKKDIGRSVVSIEKGFAEQLGIQLGDTLKFQAGQKIILAEVTSIRTVEWDSFHPNFFVIFPPGVLEKEPVNYITSFYLEPSHLNFLQKLIKKFPEISMIDTEIVMSQVKVFLSIASAAIQYLWVFTLISSFILLFAIIFSTLDQRQQEALLLRILGISDRRLLWVLLSEFLLLGILAGVMASLSANIIVYWLADRVFSLPYLLNNTVSLVGPIIGMGLVGLGGWIGTRRIFLKAPLQLSGDYFV